MPIEQVHAFTAPWPDLSAELTRRAKAGWFDTGGTVSPTEASGVVVREGLGYVVLRDADGSVLSVYRKLDLAAHEAPAEGVLNTRNSNRGSNGSGKASYIRPYIE